MNKEKLEQVDKLISFWQEVKKNNDGFTYKSSRRCEGPTINSNMEDYKVNPPREIDWLKVPVGTKVRVQISPGLFVIRYFCAYMPKGLDKYVCFPDELKQEQARDIIGYTICEIHPDVEILQEWYK